MNDVRRAGAKTASQIQDQFKRVGRRMQRIGTQMTAGITLPLIGAGGLALKTAADYESLRQSMNILNGSVEEGARNFERLKEFSARTPFQLQDLAEAQNMLQGFGQSADDAFESISMIGDIAAVTGSDIKGIGIAFGQASAEGRLMTRDIRQLINQGVPAIKLLADTMDVAKSEVFDLASQGEISFEILQQAFRDATSEGGMFANGMQKQADTLAGIFSTLKDNVSIALGDIGNAIDETFDIKGLMKDMIGSIRSGIDWFNSLSKQTRQMAFTMAGVLGASGPIIAALGTLSLAIGAISAPVAGIVAAITAGSVAIIKNWDQVTAYFTTGDGAKMWEDLKGIVNNTVRIVRSLWSAFGDDIVEATKVAWGIMLETVETTLSAINSTVKIWADIFTGDIDSAMNEAESSFQESFSNMRDTADSFFSFISRNDAISQWVFETFGFVRSEAEKAERSFVQSLDALFRARQKLKQDLKADDIIIQPEIDVSGFDTFGSKLPKFYGLSAPIEAATIQAKALGKVVGEQLTPRMNAFRTTAWNALTVGTEGMSLLQIATQGAGNRLTEAQKAAAQFGNIIGQALSQAVLHGKNLLDVVKNLAKQLASRALIQGITAIISGGFGAGKSLGKAIFGGLFHSGGIVPGSGERMVRVKGGEGIFTPGQMQAMGATGGGGTKSVRLHITGDLRGEGSTLRAVINESQHIDLS